jgi:hypothetical protein
MLASIPIASTPLAAVETPANRIVFVTDDVTINITATSVWESVSVVAVTTDDVAIDITAIIRIPTAVELALTTDDVTISVMSLFTVPTGAVVALTTDDVTIAIDTVCQWRGVAATRTWRFTVTGDADGLDDVILPISNLSARLRSGSQSYLNVTIPYASAAADAVSARPNGDLILEHIVRDNLGNTLEFVVVTVALETIQISRGASSSSIVLIGHRQSTNSNPTSHSVAPLSLQTGTTASTMIVPEYDQNIRPGDTVTGEGVTFEIGLLTLQAAVTAGSYYIVTQYTEA